MTSLQFGVKSTDNWCKLHHHFQGWIRDFKIEGAQKMCSAHYEREARNPLSLNSVGVHIGPLKALGALRFQILSHAIRGLF